MSERTDAFGRAYAGSQRQIQTYVNRRRAALDAAIPTIPAGRGEDVKRFSLGGVEILIERLCVAATCTVNGKVPAVEGAPLMTPVPPFSDRPGGKVPKRGRTDQE
jgi:hypothetical protein